MIYKILFNPTIDYNRLAELDSPAEVFVNELTGNDTVEYRDSEIGLLFDDLSNIAGLEIHNQCTKTYNIEADLISLTKELINGVNTEVEVFDSSGFSENVSMDEFRDQYCED